MNLPKNAFCETFLFVNDVAKSRTYCCQDLNVPADLYFAGVTFFLQTDPDVPVERNYAAVSYLGDRIATAPDLDTLYERALAWLATHYFHQKRMVETRRPVISADIDGEEHLYDHASGRFEPVAPPTALAAG